MNYNCEWVYIFNSPKIYITLKRCQVEKTLKLWYFEIQTRQTETKCILVIFAHGEFCTIVRSDSKRRASLVVSITHEKR